jgi:hypothetical protein
LGLSHNSDGFVTQADLEQMKIEAAASNVLK